MPFQKFSVYNTTFVIHSVIYFPEWFVLKILLEICLIHLISRDYRPARTRHTQRPNFFLEHLVHVGHFLLVCWGRLGFCQEKACPDAGCSNTSTHFTNKACGACRIVQLIYGTINTPFTGHHRKLCLSLSQIYQTVLSVKRCFLQRNILTKKQISYIICYINKIMNIFCKRSMY